MLNLPRIICEGSGCLYIGGGGGWDILGSIPLGLSRSPIEVARYANLSSQHSDFLVSEPFEGCNPEYPLQTTRPYLNLSVIGRHGVQLVRKAILEILADKEIDTIIVVDGGVDALMTGDEVGAGTFLEDSIMLAAVSGLTGYKSYLACLGFGTETDEELNHYRCLENMAALNAAGAFLGSCSLTADMWDFEYYKETHELASKLCKPSHIHSKVIAAVEGKFGNVNLEYDARLVAPKAGTFINPLMASYWFFDLRKVAARNKLVPLIEKTNTIVDAIITLRQNVSIMDKRDRQTIPL